MKKKLLIVAALFAMVLGVSFATHDVSAKVCHPDPITGEEVCEPATPATPSSDPDDPDAGSGSGGDDGYDACNNVYSGGQVPPGFCDKKTQDDLITIVGNVLNTVYFWVSILAVIFIIVGGVNYTISQGDPGKVKKAKDTIMYALVGLVVALLAFAITQFVLNALKGA